MHWKGMHASIQIVYMHVGDQELEFKIIKHCKLATKEVGVVPWYICVYIIKDSKTIVLMS